MIWGYSGIKFQESPHFVGLPDGSMLMIGMVGGRHESRIDVVKVSHKGKLASVKSAKCTPWFELNSSHMHL